MEELLVFNTNPDEPHPPGTDVALTAGQAGGGAGEQVDVEPSTPLWPERRDRTAEVQSESDQEEEREEQEWAENPESRTESVRQLAADRGSGETEMEKWEDDDSDEGVWDGGDGSLADDEEEEDDDDEDLANWMPAKASYVFSPLVTIVLPPREQSEHNGERVQYEGTAGKVLEPHPETDQPQSNQEQPQWIDTLQKPSRGCHHCCSEAMGMVGSLLLAAVIFPFLLWAGYKLLPFDTPSISTAPLRMVFTLRCAFFATFPIVLGLLVQGVSRLRFGVLRPLFSARQMEREVGVHGNYIKDSLQLSLLYFTQLAVTATYISQDLLKLVPLITIVFVFGRLIYWICVCLGSRVRALGFGLSFCPLLALLGLNLYFICSSNGQEAVFEVAPPTTPPPPKQRWWG